MLSHLFDKCSVVLSTYTNNLLHVKFYAVITLAEYIILIFIMLCSMYVVN